VELTRRGTEEEVVFRKEENSPDKKNARRNRPVVRMVTMKMNMRKSVQ